MNNLILFPGWIRLSDGLWHGCKKYRHIGEVKESISAKDWARVYQQDLRRFLRGELDALGRPSGSAA
jgi:hypothetical protein